LLLNVRAFFGRRRRRSLGAIAVLVVGLLVAGCSSSKSGGAASTSGGSAGGSGSAAGSITYKDGSPCPALPGGTITETQPSVSVAPAFSFLYAGLAAGIFKACDIDLKIATMDPTVNLSSFLGGSLKNLNVSVSSLPASVAAAGKAVSVFAPLSDKYPGEFLVNPKINSAADLKGKTIGSLSAFDSTERSAEYFLKQNNLDPTKDVRFNYISTVPSLIAAVEAGSVMAASIPQPYAAQAIATGKAKSLFKFATSDFRYPTLPLVADPSWVTANHDVALNMLRAYVASVYYVGTHIDQSVDDVVAYLKVPDGPTKDAQVAGIRTYMTGFYSTAQEILSFSGSDLKTFYDAAAPTVQAKIKDPTLASFAPPTNLSQELLNDGFLDRLKQVYGG
jgi:NitT/TauT family transport system substrate-binding protein